MHETIPLYELETFIVRAKKRTYVGGASKLLSYRLGSKDVQLIDGDWAYHDCYFGESDFIGQEVIYYRSKPIWAMNYFGYILDPTQITSSEAGKMIMKSLSEMYSEERFLGAFEHIEADLIYKDFNEGDFKFFKGNERIYRNNKPVYELVYHGGLLRD